MTDSIKKITIEKIKALHVDGVEASLMNAEQLKAVVKDIWLGTGPRSLPPALQTIIAIGISNATKDNLLACLNEKAVDNTETHI